MTERQDIFFHTEEYGHLPGGLPKVGEDLPPRPGVGSLSSFLGAFLASQPLQLFWKPQLCASIYHRESIPN